MTGALPGLGGRFDVAQLRMLGPNEWKVWPVEVPELQAQRLTGADPLSVVVGIVAGMMAEGLAPEPGAIDDYFVRGAVGKLRRVRVGRAKEMETLFIGELRACRQCGCCEDRACNPPCSWVEDDLCSACPKEKK